MDSYISVFLMSYTNMDIWRSRLASLLLNSFMIINAQECKFPISTPISPCSVTCGPGGTQVIKCCGIYANICTEPILKQVGCSGLNDVNGNWGQWEEWSSCSVTCGQGTRERSRECDNPAPQCWGSNCIGNNAETIQCNISPVHGGWGAWGPYSSCTKTCGTGSHTRSRICNNPSPSKCGNTCRGTASQTTNCNTNCCPVNGNWGQWSGWSSCPVTCGQGTRSRSRDCNRPAQSCGGSNCIGSNSGSTECNIQPVHGGWGAWSQYSSCTKTCGAGSQTRSRICNNPSPAKCGNSCSGGSQHSRNCNTNCCPVNGNWGIWTEWSACSVTCGQGTRRRNRDCNNPIPSCGGSNCIGSTTGSTECYILPVHGGWGDWGQYTSCTQTCGNGSYTRTRRCNNPSPANCGNHCGDDSSQTSDCNTNCCPVSGNWGHWLVWSQCSVTCGQGTVARERVCNNPPPFCGGELCAGDNFDRGQCDIEPVNGGWGEWSQYDACSKTCGNGTHTRTRECNNPPPAHCSEKCFGYSNETRNCNTKECSGEQIIDDISENDPKVTSVWPTYGPEAGGTTITLLGLHIDPSSMILIAQDIYCETVLVNGSMIIGITPKLTSHQEDNINKNLPITIVTDSSAQLRTEEYFMYKANPSITNVFPLGTIIRGGTYLTTKGENLNSVAKITMETTMILRELVSPKPLVYKPTFTKYETDCTTLNHSTIKCLTPTFDLPSEFTNDKQDNHNRSNAKINSTMKSRSKREAKIEFSNDGNILEFYIGFNLDGVDDYKNYSSIDVFVEPEFQLKTSVQQYTLGERLIFEGEHLDAGLTINDYNITIGTDLCSKIELVSNTLSCSPPEDEPEMVIVNEYNHPRIMIHVGIHIEHMAGYLRYPARALPLYVIILLAAIPACIVLIMIVTVSVVCVKKRQARRDETNDKSKACNDTSRNLDKIS